MTYLITFTCYGAHIHGDDTGSVDRHHNLPGSHLIEPDAKRSTAVRARMLQAPYVLDASSRQAVLNALIEHSRHRSWNLLAAHVRTNHVHAVVEAEERPERIMNAFKSYASRALNILSPDKVNRKRWTRHGSTRWLKDDEELKKAVQYVADRQGAPMALYTASSI
jgi:REP element-mobilizing transposase RayT